MEQFNLIKFPMKKSENENRYHIAEQFHSKLLELIHHVAKEHHNEEGPNNDESEKNSESAEVRKNNIFFFGESV